ncbi:bifunctional folylpolyglutamate synthase/dihydrofolate synthase [Vagococcus vulneris]|uniref:Dihydrofolate synthase/folylpolyglutamate synthase n=1 Tax=Vagococcus vulneris TaxID=1977869 RepID=A0A429ZWB7_9ENTE|nr:folylpolyglutamate synthase/dihydrofolate synthase family protein [Vagococcus vulneris]RST98067.1 tetrahydrofolate synthase [Vagococcus vulneris]
MTYEQTVNWIHDRLKFGIRPGLLRISALLEKLDNPQNKLRTVHIAGTNGKGSTTAFLRNLLEETGLTVGTFTSPYVERFNERISIDGVPIPDDDLVALLKKIQPLVIEMDQDESLKDMVEFEILTAMMLQYFVEQEVDIVIVEVGLGGLLDATNVITPIASAITTIGLDHVAILGDSLAEIAAQKAGIIKPKIPVVVGKVPKEAEKVIIKTAVANQAPVYQYGHDFNSRYHQPDGQWGESFDYISENNKYDMIRTGLMGKHQVDNASVAIKLYEIICEKLSLRSQSKIVKQSLLQTNWPGRMEKLSDSPLIVIDGAHNEHAMDVLRDNLIKEFSTVVCHVIFGALTTKDVSSMLIDLETVPNLTLKVTEFDFPSAMRQEDYEAISKTAYLSWQEALADVLSEMEENDLILITGSLYFISQVRQTLIGGTMDEEN